MFDFNGQGWLITFTFLGALILWCKDLPDQRRTYGLSEIWEHLPIVNKNVLYLTQLATFLLIGTFVALALTNPAHARQALAAGLGWTAGLSATRNAARRRAAATAGSLI